MAPEIWYTTNGLMNKWMEKVKYRGGCHTQKQNQNFELSTTLFGMKKKRTVNQILLSKLWYIGKFILFQNLSKRKLKKYLNSPFESVD